MLTQSLRVYWLHSSRLASCLNWCTMKIIAVLEKKTCLFLTFNFLVFFVSLNLFECTLVKYMIFKYIVNHIKQYMYITFQCGHVLLILLHMDDGLWCKIQNILILGLIVNYLPIASMDKLKPLCLIFAPGDDLNMIFASLPTVT